MVFSLINPYGPMIHTLKIFEFWCEFSEVFELKVVLRGLIPCGTKKHFSDRRLFTGKCLMGFLELFFSIYG
jgi:hypothetical protein